MNLLEFLELNTTELEEALENTKNLEGEELYAELAKIAKAKRTLDDAMAVVEDYESAAKSLINLRAKAVYGPDWQVIAGKGFKISRSQTGQLYEVTDADSVDPEMVKVKFTANARKIETYRETHDNTLPKGIALNEHRGESIRIAVHEDSQA